MIRPKKPTETAEDYLIARLRAALLDVTSLAGRIEKCNKPDCMVCQENRLILAHADNIIEETEAYV